MKNLGWLFYKNYYDFKSLNKTIDEALKANDKLPEKVQKSVDDIMEEATVSFFINRNKNILKEKFIKNDLFEVINSEQTFSLTTTYPGLISGSGVMHETGKLGEFKLGFSFDYTTGLPYLAGSSVKGAIRQVFPNHLRKKASVLRKTDDKFKTQLLEKANDLENYCIDLFKSTVQIDISPLQLFQFEWMVFEGKYIENIEEVFCEGNVDFLKIEEKSIPLYESDLFHDAYIEASKHKEELFLGNDFITPHLKPLKNPTPIQFLKVLPNVVWTFQFDLKQSDIFSATQKRSLFRQILLDFGIGAKTNVGYGQLK
jgi:CRISPR-associated protein Cmr6